MALPYTVLHSLSPWVPCSLFRSAKDPNVKELFGIFLAAWFQDQEGEGGESGSEDDDPEVDASLAAHADEDITHVTCRTMKHAITKHLLA